MAGPIKNVPASCDWAVYAGDRNSQTFEFYATADTPWDLTGATLRAQARLDALDAAVAIEALCTVDDAVGGIVTVSWDGELVRALLAGAESWAGVWDIELIEAAQTLPVTLLAGKFTAQLDVTRALV